MPTYVPDCEHDILVSYAHDNNEPLAEDSDGWITTLVRNLKQRLNIKIGRGKYDLWIDDKLGGNIPLDDQIMGAIENTAVLLLVLSPAYLRSEWCKKEKCAFLKTIKKEAFRAKTRVFVIEYDDTGDKRPSELNGLNGYIFLG